MILDLVRKRSGFGAVSRKNFGQRVVDACRPAGMAACLAKSFRHRELLTMIDNWLPVAGGCGQRR
jgi:hypothetical protein